MKVKVTQEMQEVLAEAVAIGSQHQREKTRHRRANNRLMVRASANVYDAYLVGAITDEGFSPEGSGADAVQAACDTARAGRPLTARAYGLVIGYSEAYMSRLFRLGLGMAAGVLDPDEETESGPNPWSILTRGIADTPEVGAVLGRERETLPTREELDSAIEKATARRKQQAADRRAKAAAEGVEGESPPWLPNTPSKQIEVLETIVDAIEDAPRRLTHNQIDRVRHVVDELVAYIEAWVADEKANGNGGSSSRRGSIQAEVSVR